jgi:RNA polymerase sigma factor (sigma-70 family)
MRGIIMPTSEEASPENDVSLLGAWQRGDRRAGLVLFRRYGSGIRRYFRKYVSSRQDVQDLVQETFLRCQKADYRQESSIRVFLFGIAHYVFLEYLRVRAKQQNRGHDDDYLLSCAPADLGCNPEDAVHLKQEMRVIMKAMRRLALHYQLVLELSLWEGLTQAEIGEVLARPGPTVGRWKQEALRALGQKVQTLVCSQELLKATTMTIASWREALRARFARGGELE